VSRISHSTFEIAKGFLPENVWPIGKSPRVSFVAKNYSYEKEQKEQDWTQ
jgi:hypothetical protein